MLFKVRDHKGTERWINPTYVRLLRDRKGKTEIWVAGQNHAVFVEHPMDKVADVVNSAMPIVDALPAESPDAADQTEMLTLLAAGVI